MRNVFDHYSQNENQLTHALFSALENDRKLLASFVHDICSVEYKNADTLSISVQRYPFSRNYLDAEIEDRNIPDAWIFDEDFALVFEAKITADLTQSQLSGHEKIAARFFDASKFFTIAAGEEKGNFKNWKPLTWKEIYVWLRVHEVLSEWAKHAADYFEILEARMQDQGQLGDEELTSFSGFPDDKDGYSYLIAKSSLKKAMRELRKDQRLIDVLGMNPNAAGRGAITGAQLDGVWDFLALHNYGPDARFNNFQHLTLGVEAKGVTAKLTFPDKLNSATNKRLKQLGEDEFVGLIESIASNMTPLLTDVPNARPVLSAIQRHWPNGMRSKDQLDAALEADIRTILNDSSKQKFQPQWVRTTYELFAKRRSNIEMQIGVNFEHGNCPEIHGRDALDLIARAWLACEPLVSLCRTDEG